MSQPCQPSQKHKVAVIGSGKWGTTIGKILAENVKENSLIFDTIVPMWVFEEDIDIESIPSNNPTLRDKLGIPPLKLSQAINKIHQNIKYLPGITLPENLIANDNLKDTVKGASILVFSLPGQYLQEVLDEIKGYHRPYARGVAFVKGGDVSDGAVEMIMEKLQIYCGTLSGGNVAGEVEVAKEKVREMIIGYHNPSMDMSDYQENEGGEGGKESLSRENLIDQGQINTKQTHIHLTPIPKEYPPLDKSLLKKLFGRPYFHVHTIPDEAGVSIPSAGH